MTIELAEQSVRLALHDVRDEVRDEPDWHARLELLRQGEEHVRLAATERIDRMLGSQRGKFEEQKPLREPLRCGEAYGPANRSVLRVAQATLERRGDAGYLFRRPERGPSCIGERKSIRCSSDELRAECFFECRELRVTDIYDTPQSFEAFGKVLAPILGSLGIELGRPEVVEVHNVIRG